MAHYNHSPTSSEETQASPPPRPFNNTQEYLQHLSAEFVDGMNKGAFRETAYRLVIPEFKGLHEQDDEEWIFDSRDAMIKHMVKFLERNPRLHTEILDSNAEVDEGKGVGRVMILRSVTGLAGGIEKEAFTELSWVRCAGGEWLCSGYRGLRGFSLFSRVDGG